MAEIEHSPGLIKIKLDKKEARRFNEMAKAITEGLRSRDEMMAEFLSLAPDDIKASVNPVVIDIPRLRHRSKALPDSVILVKRIQAGADLLASMGGPPDADVSYEDYRRLTAEQEARDRNRFTGRG